MANLNTNQTQEVEIRAVLNEEQKQNLSSLLKERGVKSSSTEHLIDSYFCPISIVSFSEIEMDSVGSYSLRVRKKVKNNSTPQIEINTKMITQFGDHNSWAEHEISSNSYEESIEILKTIGFKNYFNLEKTRLTYQIDDINLNLEEIVGFGPILEAEIITTPEKSEEAKSKIKKLFEDLSVDPNQVVPKSITNILMKQQAKF